MIDENGKTYFYLSDHLGSARKIFDTTGTVKDSHKYTAFGQSGGQSTTTNQAYRYTGKPFDEELSSNLYYYGARYYDPDLGQFISVDPLRGKYPEWGPYIYTLQNPLKYIDPDGRSVGPNILDQANQVYTGAAQKLANAAATVINSVTIFLGFGAKVGVQAGNVDLSAGGAVEVAVDPAGRVKDLTVSSGVSAEVGGLSGASASVSTSLVNQTTTAGVSASVGSQSASSSATVDNSGNVTTSSSTSSGGASANSSGQISGKLSLGPVTIGAAIDPTPSTASDITMTPQLISDILLVF